MNRRLRSKDLVPLIELSELREMLARSAAQTAKRNLDAVGLKMSELRNTTHQVANPQERGLLEKWQRWQQSELMRLGELRSRRAAEYKTLSETLGRLAAESEVLREISKSTIARERKLVARRRDHIS